MVDGMSQATLNQVQALAQGLLARGERLSTAESCTGGLVAAACTDLAGSSQWFDRGFVTYSNQAKHEQLGVPLPLIVQQGAVSQAVAQAMALGALDRSQAQHAVAITGIAGPTGGSPDKPVGTVWFAWAHRPQGQRQTQIRTRCQHFGGDRAAVRHAALQTALEGLTEQIQIRAPAPARLGAVRPVKIAFLSSLPADQHQAWQQRLSGALAAVAEVQWCEGEDQVQAEIAIVANPPEQAWQPLLRAPALRWVQSLWAGVDRLLAVGPWPEGVTLTRLVDPALTQAMVETALWATLSLHRGFFDYARLQASSTWRVLPQTPANGVRVGVLGQGQLGAAVTRALAGCGYGLSTWRRGDHDPGDQIDEPGLRVVLAQSDILINLLPLTPQTRGLLNQARLDALPPGASLVNLARGAHVVDTDLLAALDRGHLRHAVLDVFHTEPLPADHRYWRHPQVTVLPHAAALTDLDSAAQGVADQLRRYLQGALLRDTVDLQRGY